MNSTAFSLEVQNGEFTKALKRLSRCQKGATKAYLRYKNGALVISLGQASESLLASGSWPGIVAVSATWAKAFATTPLTVNAVWLRVSEGKLYTRDHAVLCKVVHEIPTISKSPKVRIPVSC